MGKRAQRLFIVLAVILVIEAIGTFKRPSARKAAANA
jgi:uncharacterized protein YjeT (DUF2065 family)